MRRLAQFALVVLVAVLASVQAFAADLYIPASAMDLPSGTSCSKVVENTSTVPRTVIECPQAGGFGVWYGMFPTDQSAGGNQNFAIYADWTTPASGATGKFCPKVTYGVVKDGENWNSAFSGTPAATTVAPISAPSQNLLYDGAISLTLTPKNVAGTACHGTNNDCRGLPFVVKYERDATGSCTSNSSSPMRLIGVHLVY